MTSRLLKICILRILVVSDEEMHLKVVGELSWYTTRKTFRVSRDFRSEKLHLLRSFSDLSLSLSLSEDYSSFRATNAPTARCISRRCFPFPVDAGKRNDFSRQLSENAAVDLVARYRERAIIRQY